MNLVKYFTIKSFEESLKLAVIQSNSELIYKTMDSENKI